jgi:hypothetical protein
LRKKKIEMMKTEYRHNKEELKKYSEEVLKVICEAEHKE